MSLMDLDFRTKFRHTRTDNALNYSAPMEVS